MSFIWRKVMELALKHGVIVCDLPLLQDEVPRVEEARRAGAGAREGARAPDPTWLRRTTGARPASLGRPRRAARPRPPAGRGCAHGSPAPLSFSIPAQTARAHGITRSALGPWRTTYCGKPPHSINYYS